MLNADCQTHGFFYNLAPSVEGAPASFALVSPASEQAPLDGVQVVQNTIGQLLQPW
jgi:hypothetical protein